MDQTIELRPDSEAAPGRLDAHLAFLVTDLRGGGVQKMITILATALAERGARIDILVCEDEGDLKEGLPESVSIIPLKKRNPITTRLAALRADIGAIAALARPLLSRKHGSKSLRHMPSLADYLRTARPDTLFAATPYLNIEAVLARRLARVATRIVVSERSHFSSGKPRKEWRRRNLTPLLRKAYLEADAIVAVSHGVAADIAATAGIPREAITTLYNPTITPDFAARMREPVAHPWFAEGAPPVVLGVGRLAYQKDFPTLVRAFARVVRERPARLVIAGQGNRKDFDRLYTLASELGIRDRVDLLGHVANPVAYTARAAVFVLSSRFEGFPNVVLEALACGTPVVSTDCPSGPREILDDGAYGALVPVGDDAALAAAISATLDDPPDARRLQARAAVFDYDTAIMHYEAVLLGKPVTSSHGLGSRVPATVAAASAHTA